MATSKLVKAILDPKKNWFAALHKKTIETRLRKYGLRYDDLFDPMESLDIKEALARLPREIVDARNQRLLRAMDLSMKHEYLPEHLQAQQTPFRSYLSDMLALARSHMKKILKYEPLKGQMGIKGNGSVFYSSTEGDVEREKAERQALGALPLQQRTIP